MQNSEKVEKLVYEVVKDINKMAVQNLNTERIGDIPLQERLDSLAMVNLVVSLEETIKQEFGISISLVGSDTEDSSPFKTIGSLVHYICSQLEKKKRS